MLTDLKLSPRAGFLCELYGYSTKFPKVSSDFPDNEKMRVLIPFPLIRLRSSFLKICNLLFNEFLTD